MTPPLDDDDHDRTVIRPASAAAAAGATMTTRTTPAADNADDDDHALPVGTLLGEFELTGKLGEGGFSIVYLARDQSLGRMVALKEYMPSSIASRKGQTQVNPRSERHRDTFEAGLRSFINEAQLLAQYDHASLVKVHRFWEANGTAYMIMPFYEGVTLKDTVRAMAEPPDEAWLLRMLNSLTEALVVIHADQCYHRDIAPDNVILLARTNKPLLLDFGAARRVISDMTQALTVILKPGYAPVEQYAEVPGMKQGPWTDVYALAATVYWCIAGKPPPPAVGRMLSDTHQPLAEVGAGLYSQAFLAAVDRALVVLPDQRTQTIEAFRQDLGLDDEQGEPIPLADVPRTQGPRTVAKTLPPKAMPGATPSAMRPMPAVAPSSPVTNGALGGKRGMAIAAAVAVLALGGGTVWWMQRPAAVSNQPAANAPPAAVTAPSSVATPAVQPAPTASPTPTVDAVKSVPPPASSPVATAPEPVVVSTPAPTPAPVTAPPQAAVSARPKAPRERTQTGDQAPPKRAAATTRASGNEAECATLLQRISLGEASPELISRLKQLHCG